MLISSTPPSVTYVYTGGSTYSVPFAFYGKETIKVSYSPPPTPGQLDIEPFIPLVYAIDYNVDGTLAGPHDGTDAFKYGNVTLTSAGHAKLANGTKVLVSRRTPAEQKFAYGELDNFPAKSHENALGHLTVVAQELRQDIVRTLQVPEGVADPQGVLSYLFDVAVRAEEELGHSLRIAENLNDLDNKATARTNLGLGSAATRNIGNAAGQVLTAGSATISTSHPLAGGGALSSNLTLRINSATAATATANGSSGSVVYAADNNTNARNLAATPANVAKQVDDALTAFATRTISTTAPLMGGGNLAANRTLTISPATAATQTEPGEAGSVVYAADTDYTSRDKAATPAGVSYQIIDAVFGVVSDVLRVTNNLDDVADKEQARQNLQVAKIDHTHSADDITAGTFNSARLPTVPISKGGTGATSQSAARTNLELGSAAVRDVGTEPGEVPTNSVLGSGTASKWSEDGAPYPINAQVYHNGKQWLALRPNSVAPTEGADWTELVGKQYIDASVIAGTVLAFTGELGGSDGKRPINPYTGQADEGWALCDGSTYQAKSDTPMLPTPDLRGRFVMAADVTRPSGTIGGGEGHTHNITVNPHTLTVAQMPSHTHGIQRANTDGSGVQGYNQQSAKNTAAGRTTEPRGDSQPHTHGASSSEGSNLPPYYALAYIMKL